MAYDGYVLPTMLNISRNFYDETNDESVLTYACMRAEFEGKLLKNCPKQRSSLLSVENF